MPKIIALKCPSCGGNVYIKEDQQTCFCQHCGTQIIIDDGNQTITHKTIDTARIKEAEISEKIRLKELEIEQQENKATNIMTVLLLLFALFLMVWGSLQK